MGTVARVVRADFHLWERRAHRAKEPSQGRGFSLCQMLQWAPEREVIQPSAVVPSPSDREVKAKRGQGVAQGHSVQGEHGLELGLLNLRLWLFLLD